MTISDKARKSLWAKSANRCAICRIELIQDSESNKEFNIGEECHIISKREKGPRHNSNITDYDSYDNLILLCRNHHREIDEMHYSYPEEVLRYIKTNHENWVRETIDLRLKSGNKEKPKFLYRITSGKDLLNMISDSDGYQTDYDELQNEEETQYIGMFIQSLVDYGDITSFVEHSDKVDTGYKLSLLLNELDEKGFYLFGEKNIKQVKYSNGKQDNWKVPTLIIKRKNSPEIIKINGEQQE